MDNIYKIIESEESFSTSEVLDTMDKVLGSLSYRLQANVSFRTKVLLTAFLLLFVGLALMRSGKGSNSCVTLLALLLVIGSVVTIIFIIFSL